MTKLILASNSPRRKELLALFGWPFEVIPADIDESRKADEPAVDYVRRLAGEKAQAVAENHEGLILAADTIVVDGEELLGKPVDDADARRMLTQLRGRTHQVYTEWPCSIPPPVRAAIPSAARMCRCAIIPMRR